ncbi:uncharacterized protein C7orf50 homolog isoform X5 [Ovis aries]|uniref:uncharacterized protein C7orf50 homolog isoform X5 n=1 Tax=Ovis aries TaxID=9940 RepID=UPI0029528821|nr:uncharacterized protein C7orf50 homolog isoform X5 [Ovis aries]
MARRPGAARPLLGGLGPAALVARALVSASLGLVRRGRRRTGGSSSRAPPPSTLLGGCPGLAQGPGGAPAGLQTSDGSAPVPRHTGALAPRTHRRQRDHGGTEFVGCEMAKQKRKESEVAEKKSKKLKKVSAVEMPAACAAPPGPGTAPAEDTANKRGQTALPESAKATRRRALGPRAPEEPSGVCIRVPVPGGAEGPGKEAEEGAEEGSAEAAAGGGRRCGPKPGSQALRGRAGPAVLAQLGPEARGLEVPEDEADLAAVSHV